MATKARQGGAPQSQGCPRLHQFGDLAVPERALRAYVACRQRKTPNGIMWGRINPVHEGNVPSGTPAAAWATAGADDRSGFHSQYQRRGFRNSVSFATHPPRGCRYSYGILGVASSEDNYASTHDCCAVTEVVLLDLRNRLRHDFGNGHHISAPHARRRIAEDHQNGAFISVLFGGCAC